MVNYQMCILFYISLTTQAGVSSTKGGGIEYVDLITNFTPRILDLPTALTGSVSVESSDEIWKKNEATLSTQDFYLKSKY